MSARLDRRFADLGAQGRAGFVPFVMAGDPDPATARALLLGLPDAGADIVELGMPFTDPMADGPAIQAAGLRALKAGQTLEKTLALAAEFRARHADTPLVLMGYLNPILSMGADRFTAAAATAGVDGLIVVDMPPEEDASLGPMARASGLALIRLATPTTDAARLPDVLRQATGFLYYVSITGITGTSESAAGEVAAALAALRRATALPLAVGFGIRTAQAAAAMARVADAVVVGSALVSRLAEGLGPDGRPAPDCVPGVLALARELAAAVHAVVKEPRHV